MADAGGMGRPAGLRLIVSGMKCVGCVAKANAALAALPGFRAATFDLSQGTAIVDGDVEPTRVMAALQAAGYPARLTTG